MCVLCAFIYCYVCFFFFFKQKTAYEMRISDWSSDVCSSDLHARVDEETARTNGGVEHGADKRAGEGSAQGARGRGVDGVAVVERRGIDVVHDAERGDAAGRVVRDVLGGDADDPTSAIGEIGRAHV